MKKQRKNNTEKMKNQKISWLAKAVYAAAAILAVAPTANAMHIMEGYLPPAFCIAWGIVCLPFLVFGFRSLNRRVKENRRSITLIAMAGAFVFVLSSLKIPSVTGSCSHMTGTGLGAILFGPCAVSVLGNHCSDLPGSVARPWTTLGANCFSMAITGPILSWLIYKGLSKTRINRRITVFLAASLGDLFTYCVTSVQLALAYPSAQGGVTASAVKFLGIFAPTQLPLAVIEGILTVVVVIALESFAKSELKAIDFEIEEEKE